MLRFILTCACLFYTHTSIANKDSLLTIWNNENLADTIRLLACHDLINSHYMYEDLDSALMLSEQHHVLAKKRNSIYWESKSINCKGNIAYYKGEKEKAIQYYKEAISLIDILGDTLNSCNVAINIAGIYLEYGDIEEAIVILHPVYTKAKRLKNPDLLNTIAFSLGLSYDLKEEYSKALIFYNESNTILEENDFDKSETNDPYGNIGSIYETLNNFVLAEEYYKKGIEFAELNQVRDKNAIIIAYAALGNIYQKRGSIRIAKEYLKKSMDIAREYPDFKHYLLGPLLSFSEMSLEENSPVAIQYINELIEVAKEMEEVTDESAGYIHKGTYYFQNKEFSKGLFWCEKGDKLAKEINQLQYKKASCDCLYQVNKALGKVDKALILHEELLVLSDSMVNETRIQEVTQTQMQYEFGKEQLQDSLAYQQELFIVNQQKEVLELKNRNNQLTIAGICLLGLIGLGFFLNIRRKNQLITQQKDKLEQANITKDRLFAIIAHDLRKPALAFRGISKKVNFLIQQKEFDTLNTFGEGLEKSAFALNSLLDNLLNWALQQRDVLPYQPKAINVEQATEEIYDLFHQIAADKDITLNLELEHAPTVFTDPNAFTTIIRNLVDNAIKYTPKGGAIVLSATKIKDKISLKISDNGVGISSEKVAQIFELQKGKSTQGTIGEKGSGLGLSLVKDLVQLNRGEIFVQSSLQGGTTFELLLPAT